MIRNSKNLFFLIGGVWLDILLVCSLVCSLTIRVKKEVLNFLGLLSNFDLAEYDFNLSIFSLLLEANKCDSDVQ